VSWGHAIALAIILGVLSLWVVWPRADVLGMIIDVGDDHWGDDA